MNKLMLLSVLVGSASFAADVSLGSNLFNARCASCHQAIVVKSKDQVRLKKNPANLVVLFQKTPERFNAWVLDPEVQKKADVACDTTNLEANDLANLFAFLRSQSVEPVPTRARRIEELNEGLRRSKLRTSDGVRR